MQWPLGMFGHAIHEYTAIHSVINSKDMHVLVTLSQLL